MLKAQFRGLRMQRFYERPHKYKRMWARVCVCLRVSACVGFHTFIIPFQLSPVDTRNSVRKAIPKFSKVA